MAKLGTHKRPAIVRVRTVSRAEEIVSLCNDRGWQVIAGVEPDKPEDTTDLERLLAAGAQTGSTVRPAQGTGRNASCPCGSGKRYKRCCGAR